MQVFLGRIGSLSSFQALDFMWVHFKQKKKKKNVSTKIYIGCFAILLGSNFHWSVNGQLLMYHLNYPFRNGCMEKEADAQSCL